MWAEAQEAIVKLKRSLVKAQEKNVTFRWAGGRVGGSQAAGMRLCCRRLAQPSCRLATTAHPLLPTQPRSDPHPLRPLPRPPRSARLTKMETKMYNAANGTGAARGSRGAAGWGRSWFGGAVASAAPRCPPASGSRR